MYKRYKRIFESTSEKTDEVNVELLQNQVDYLNDKKKELKDELKMLDVNTENAARIAQIDNKIKGIDDNIDALKDEIKYKNNKEVENGLI